MSAGIYTVAFGVDYDRCAAYAFRHSRENTNLPFCVATNLTEAQRCPVWHDVDGVTFVEFLGRSQGENRRAKLQMDLVSPFDRTLYIDADCVIQNAGAVVFEAMLERFELVLNWRIRFRPQDRIWNLYARTMRTLGAKKPIDIYNGGIIAFVKNERTREFFAMWLRAWEVLGKGREMPALNCCVNMTDLAVGHFPLLYFADAQMSSEVVIQHHCGGFNERFSIPPWKHYKPFDSGRKDDFRLEATP